MKPMIFLFLAMALSHAEASCSTPAPTPPPPTPPPTPPATPPPTPPATPPPPASNPSCDFNTNLCKWQQSKSDQFDWTRRSGRTPSSSASTGPSAGHGGRGSYIYIETSSPRRQNDKAILTFKGANSKSVCLSFYYYMYGRDINRLIIYNAGRIIWSKSLEQGIGWKKAEVLINSNFDLKIEGIRGASYRGDIAIDDISVADGSCGGTVPPTLTPGPTDPSCDFNTNLCKWQQSKSDQFDWTRRSGRTPSSSTGPSAGYGGRGSYIYIETSSPRRQNDKAILTFKGANSKSVCLSFYYYMYGRDINRLIIYNAGRIIWSKSLEQGIGWKKAEVLINGNFDLKIEGIRGASYRGDIAIDDISVADGSCGGTVPPTPTPGPTVPPGPTKCGVSPMTRVVGGVNAVPGNWPWQIALLRGRSKTFSCGGTLIAPDWIVTAAHCIPFLTGSYYTVRLGEHNRRVKEGTEEEIPGKRVIKHPSYNWPSPLNNDIALIQLARPAKLSARVGTVCLPSHNENVPTSAKCFITGWGKIKHPGSSHHILQQAKLPPVTNDVCAKKLEASPGLSGFKITNQMICAGVEGTLLSGCHGDSGGPYVCQSLNRNWVLQGAVSWGSPRCSAAERYTVFARVAQFRNWINQYVRV